MSLNDLSFERKRSSMSDWKSKLASKFKGNKEYEVLGNDDGINVESYKKTSDEFGEPLPTAPKTEPVKRRPMQNGGVGNGRILKDDPNKQQISVATSSKRPTSNTTRNSRAPVENGRRVRLKLKKIALILIAIH